MRVSSDRFAAIPQFVIEEASGTAVKLYGVLYGLGSFDRPERQATRPALAEALGASVDTVDRTLTELETIGAVQRQRTKLPSGSWGPTRYLLVAARGSRTDAARWPQPYGQGGRTSADSSLPVSELEPRALQDAFDTFMDLYPREDSREAASASFRRRVRGTKTYAALPIDVILDGARRFASDPNLPGPDEAAYIPRATTWLNQGRWADGPLPARGRKRGQVDRGALERHLDEVAGAAT